MDALEPPERSPAFRRYAADASLVLGGPAAILLQIADPVVGEAVAAHSAFATDPMRRLRTTLTFVWAVGLGTATQRARAAAFVNRAHRGIPGADDPDRQLWVAATLARLGVATHELLHGPLDAATAAEVHAASAELGEVLRVPRGAWPADREAFDRYWEAAVARLEVGEAARRVASDLFAARAAPWWVRAGMPLGRAITAGLLPASVREAYGLPHRPRAVAAAIGLVRVLARITPRRLRELPSRRLLAALDRAPDATTARPADADRAG
ncbi:MAG: DUF2236 domain-containing protein [Actinomycetales bacterium]|nr:DUF2236 domain-containing protein [Actinomycetales bacterium]